MGGGPRSGEEALARLRDNAFHVLELPPSASRHDVERQGQKLLGMLELGLSAAKRYPTPVGPCERDADKVRVALARLRDPDARLEEELWARLPARGLGDGGAAGDGDLSGGDDPSGVDDSYLKDLPRVPRADRPWAEAMGALGWGRR
jgi:hypothetical protein